MKNQLITILSIILILSACSKSSTSTTPSGTSLNNTENQLLGNWYCSMEIDSINATKVDTVLSTGNPYVSFQDSLAANFPGTNTKAKDCTWAPGFVVGGSEVPGYWYYDESIQKLNLYGQSYSLISINGTNMVLEFSAAHHSYYYFHR